MSYYASDYSFKNGVSPTLAFANRRRIGLFSRFLAIAAGVRALSLSNSEGGRLELELPVPLLSSELSELLLGKLLLLLGRLLLGGVGGPLQAISARYHSLSRDSTCHYALYFSVYSRVMLISAERLLCQKLCPHNSRIPREGRREWGGRKGAREREGEGGRR